MERDSGVSILCHVAAETGWPWSCDLWSCGRRVLPTGAPSAARSC